MDSCQAEVDNLGGLAAGPEPEARHKVSFLLNQRHRLFEEDNLFLCRVTVDLEQESWVYNSLERSSAAGSHHASSGGTLRRGMDLSQEMLRLCD